MRLPRMTSAYLVPLALLGAIVEMTCSYFYYPRPFLSLLQFSTMVASLSGFLAAVSMSAFLYREPDDGRAWRWMAWITGVASIVATVVAWTKYLLNGPGAEFNGEWFRTSIIMTAIAVVYTTMGIITWRLLRSKDTEVATSSDAPVHSGAS